MWNNTYWYVKVALVAMIVLIVVGVVWLTRPLFSKAAAGGTESGDVVGTVGALPPVVPSSTVSGGTTTTGTGSAAVRPPAVGTISVPPEVMRRVLTQLDEAKRKQAAGQPLEARTVIDGIMKDPAVVLFSDAWEACVPLLNEVNAVFLFTDAPCPEKEAYTVQAGDSLWKIARKYNSTIPMVQRNNNMDVTNPTIMPGQVLHVLKATYSIEVSKDHYTLVLRDGERIVRVYKVGIGRQDRTPEAKFTMVDKVIDPPWTYKGKVIPFGDPENVLGTRWMKLEAVADVDKHFVGYGIHGTWQPESIGTAASNGCIRMKNEQVEELYDILPVGIPVTIHD